MAEARFFAADFGASVGKFFAGIFGRNSFAMEEVHRFANRPVRLGGTLHWDFPSLYAEVLNTMRACAERGEELAAVSVDTWGVDFGLIGADGALLGNPVHYRDARTDGIHEHAAKIMPIEEIFAVTALHTMPINTLFQLHAMQRGGSPLLDVADTFLMMPDLIAYFLTGVKASELCIAQTSQLVDTDCKWSDEIIGRFGLPRGIFPKIIGPAEVIGPMTPSVQEEAGLGAPPAGDDLSDELFAHDTHDEHMVRYRIGGIGADRLDAVDAALETGLGVVIGTGTTSRYWDFTGDPSKEDSIIGTDAMGRYCEAFPEDKEARQMLVAACREWMEWTNTLDQERRNRVLDVCPANGFAYATRFSGDGTFLDFAAKHLVSDEKFSAQFRTGTASGKGWSQFGHRLTQVFLHDLDKRRHPEKYQGLP